MNIIQYSVLAFILIAGIASFQYVKPDSTAQLMIGIATSVAYVAWGIIHHFIRRDLHKRVVVEYILIGAIAITLLVTVIDL